MRRLLLSVGCLLVLSPILPFYLLRAGLQAGIDFLDWAVEGRAWCQPFVRASERLEDKLYQQKD